MVLSNGICQVVSISKDFSEFLDLEWEKAFLDKEKDSS